MNRAFRVPMVQMASPETGEMVTRPPVPWDIPYSSIPGPDKTRVVLLHRDPTPEEESFIRARGGADASESERVAVERIAVTRGVR